MVSSKTGVKGLHCSACVQTFWPANTSFGPYDFFEFDGRVREVKGYYEDHKDPGLLLRELFAHENPIRVGLTAANITITNEKYLPLHAIEDGLTFIKSPKGSGKTEALKRLFFKSQLLALDAAKRLRAALCDQQKPASTPISDIADLLRTLLLSRQIDIFAN